MIGGMLSFVSKIYAIDEVIKIERGLPLEENSINLNTIFSVFLIKVHPPPHGRSHFHVFSYFLMIHIHWLFFIICKSHLIILADCIRAVLRHISYPTCIAYDLQLHIFYLYISTFCKLILLCLPDGRNPQCIFF